MQALKMYQQFSGNSLLGGGAKGGLLGGDGGTSSAGYQSAIGGDGSWLSTAGPWALLAAAIIGNETSAKNHNYNWTDEKGNKHEDPLRPNGIKDALIGDALHYDVQRRYNPYLDELTGGDPSKGKEGWWTKSGLGGEFQLFADLGSPTRWDDLNFKDTTMGKGLSWIKGLLD
jgi:hypothetical protein